VVTANGMLLDPAITVPQEATSITIGSDGTVSAMEPGNATPTNLGQIQLVRFINPTGLEPIGDNLYRETQASGTPVANNPGEEGLGSLRQCFLETSNVNVVEELVCMIEAQRAYEMNSKSISTSDQMLGRLTQL
jgi:flagellar basal-body rod protein FlgG